LGEPKDTADSAALEDKEKSQKRKRGIVVGTPEISWKDINIKKPRAGKQKLSLGKNVISAGNNLGYEGKNSSEKPWNPAKRRMIGEGVMKRRENALRYESFAFGEFNHKGERVKQIEETGKITLNGATKQRDWGQDPPQEETRI